MKPLVTGFLYGTVFKMLFAETFHVSSPVSSTPLPPRNLFCPHGKYEQLNIHNSRTLIFLMSLMREARQAAVQGLMSVGGACPSVAGQWPSFPNTIYPFINYQPRLPPPEIAPIAGGGPRVFTYKYLMKQQQLSWTRRQGEMRGGEIAQNARTEPGIKNVKKNI